VGNVVGFNVDETVGAVGDDKVVGEGVDESGDIGETGAAVGDDKVVGEGVDESGDVGETVCAVGDLESEVVGLGVDNSSQQLLTSLLSHTSLSQ